MAVPAAPPVSVARTVSGKLGVVSRSSAAEFATVSSPVTGLRANAPLVFPAVKA